MDRAELDKIVFCFKQMLSYKNYVKDDVKLLNKVYLILGVAEKNNEENVNTYKYFINSVTKVTLDIAQVLGEENKEYFLSQIPRAINIALLDDEQKLELLDDLEPIEQKAVIQSFKYSDEEKIALLDRITNEFYRTEIIRSIEDDNKKIELLESVKKEKDRASIIESVQDEEKKIALLETCKSEANKTNIVVSLKDDNKKIELLKTIESEENKTRVIKSLHDDDKKIQLLEVIKRNKNKVDIIISIKNDDKKIEILKEIKNIIDRVKIIKSIQDDDKKIGLIDESIDEFSRMGIIKTLQDDDKKISMLDTITNESDRCEIIKGLQVDDKKIEALSYLDNSNLKLAVIRTINDDFKKDYALSMIDKNLDRVYQTISEFRNRKGNSNHKYKKINLPEDMTFGIEIESAGEYRALFPIPIGKWRNETDDSIGNNGIEIVSPVMKDKQEFVYEIYKVNEILQIMRMEPTQNCGGHVHIGADYIKTEEGFKQLIELWGNAEEVYFLISNKQGEVPREYTVKYATPISKKFEGVRLRRKSGNFIEDAKKIQAKRKTSLNLFDVNKRRNTIEFRLSNGTLDGDTWIENIRLYGRTVQVAEILGEIVEKIKSEEELTLEEKKLFALKEMLKDKKSLDEKMQILMHILFDKQERKVYQERFDANKKLAKKELDFEMLQFGKVDLGTISEETEAR